MPIDVEKLKKVAITGWARGGGFALVLQPIGKPDETEGFGPFESHAAALAFHDGEIVTPYTEEQPDQLGDKPVMKLIRKNFRKGGPLEMMNPLRPDQIEATEPDPKGYGIWEIAMQVIEWGVVND
jgi:hypothetical protein